MAKPVQQRTQLWQMVHLFILALDFWGSTAATTTIEVNNGGKWGDWQEVKMCPHNFYAYGFSLRVERSQGRGDDTALSGIRLMCKHITYHIDEILMESPGIWGDWTAKHTCSSGYLDSFQLRVKYPQGKGDDTAANNMNVHCSNGDILEGDRWSSKCPNGVCGIQVRMEGRQGGGDDNALNDVKMICC